MWILGSLYSRGLCNPSGYIIYIISKPEKGACVIILNKQDYNNKMADILNNTTKFKIFGSVDDFDKTALEEQWIKRELFGFYNEHLIP